LHLSPARAKPASRLLVNSVLPTPGSRSCASGCAPANRSRRAARSVRSPLCPAGIRHRFRRTELACPRATAGAGPSRAARSSGGSPRLCAACRAGSFAGRGAHDASHQSARDHRTSENGAAVRRRFRGRVAGPRTTAASESFAVIAQPQNAGLSEPSQAGHHNRLPKTIVLPDDQRRHVVDQERVVQSPQLVAAPLRTVCPARRRSRVRLVQRGGARDYSSRCIESPLEIFELVVLRDGRLTDQHTSLHP